MDYYEIPVQELNEGLRQCAKNIRRFKLDVQVLLKSRSDWHAIALAIFACEELGKYQALLQAKKNAKGDTVRVSKLLFGLGGGHRSHEYKMALAQQVPPPEARTLVPRYILSPSNRPIIIEKVEASAAMRLACLFVDWNAVTKEWFFGTPISPAYLKDFVDAIVAALYKLETHRNPLSPDS
jgi:AbiV family abortive infection protein